MNEHFHRSNIPLLNYDSIVWQCEIIKNKVDKREKLSLMKGISISADAQIRKK